MLFCHATYMYTSNAPRGITDDKFNSVDSDIEYDFSTFVVFPLI